MMLCDSYGDDVECGESPLVVDEEVDKEVDEEISEEPEVVGVDVDVVVEGVFYWARYRK